MTSGSPPVRVLHLAAADIMLYPILRDQLCYLREQGYDVHTASIDGPLARRLHKEDGFPWIALPLNRRLAPWADWRAVRFIRDFCRQGKFDIVHTHTPKGNVVGQYAARRAGVPIVLQTLHGFYFHERMPWFKRRAWVAIERFSAKRSDLVLFQNPEDIETARRECIGGEEQRVLLGNGIDLRHFRPDLMGSEQRAAYRRRLGLPADALVVGMCGRLVHEKGFPEFIQAGRALLPRFPNLYLLAVGHRLESERPGDAWTPAKEGLDRGHLVVLENRDDMAELYNCMDVHVLLSHREGFPRSLMEGAACGLPQVATNIRGCRQTVVEDQTGYLVPVGDMQTVTSRLGSLLADQALRGRYGAAARAKAAVEFDQQRVFQIVAQCYAGLLERRRAR